MLAGLLLLETLSIGLFGALMTRQQTQRVRLRARQRLAYEASSLALQSEEDLLQDKPSLIGVSVRMMGEGPTVAQAKVTDPAGKMLFISKGDASQAALGPAERAVIPLLQQRLPRCLTLPGDQWECAQAIYTNGTLQGYAWVEYNKALSQELLSEILSDTALFGIIWIVASGTLVLLMARSISRPLAVLHRGTRALMRSPESTAHFPLPVSVNNEFGDLIDAFNRMVASIDEQRAGLRDTLSLLDSMLANAPIGLAFFDRRCRFVRVNQVFAEITGLPLTRHLGRTLPELLPQPEAQDLEDAILRVFAEERPVRNLEVSGHTMVPNSGSGASAASVDKAAKVSAASKLGRTWTWIVSAYPVWTTPEQVRWAGVIVLDATDRKRSEEALRKSEKLAATGRLAASIAHEINNPLEAITNLLFLLRNFCQLEDPALNYVTLAENEVHRIAEITQQTLRFYRQSTLPTRARMSDLLDSVLSLYHGRLHSINIKVERRYDPQLDLFCFAGELRQVFANLVGNSLDAVADGDRLLVRASRSRDWRNPAQAGVRFAIADTGSGMEPHVRERAFEAFFTTKEVTGTGLGLWVSHEIITKHHGRIRLRSRTNASGKPSGTVFQIFIPDVPPAVAEEKQPAEIATA